jgi:hypothetical protein
LADVQRRGHCEVIDEVNGAILRALDTPSRGAGP